MNKKEELKDKDVNVKTNKETIPILKLFQFASKTDMFLIIIATITSIISGTILLISIIFFDDVLKQMAEAVANELDIMEHALPVVRLYIYLGVGALVASYFSNALWVLTGELQTKRICQLYLHSILRQDTSWFDKAEVGSLSTRLASDIVLIQEGISEKIGQTILGISQFLAGCFVAFYKGWRLAIVTAAVAPLIVILGGLLGILVTEYTVEAQNAYAEAGSVCKQIFEGIRTVYSFSLQNRFADKYDRKLDKTMKAGVKRGIILGIGFGIFMFCLFSMYGSSFWYGSKSVHEHKMDGTTVLVVFLAMMMGEMCLLSVPTNLAAISGASAAAFNIFQTIKRVPIIDSASPLGVKPANVWGEIEFTKVKFSYPTRPDTVILKNLNLKINLV